MADRSQRPIRPLRPRSRHGRLPSLPPLQKELEARWGVPVFDRFTVVLHIFRCNARTKEARLQVALAELPLLRYLASAGWRNVPQTLFRRLCVGPDRPLEHGEDRVRGRPRPPRQPAGQVPCPSSTSARARPPGRPITSLWGPPSTV